MFLGKDVLKICSKFTVEHPCRSVISIMLLSNLHALNHDFCFFACQNLTNFVEAYIFDWLLRYINKTCCSYISCFFKREIIELLLLPLCFKVEHPTNRLQNLQWPRFLQNLSKRGKTVASHQIFLWYLGLKFPKF